MSMYEKYWQSDGEEEDVKEVEDLKKDGFIADLKKCDQMPLVLPAKDEFQFRKLLNRDARKREKAEESTSQTQQVTKMEIDHKNIKAETHPDAIDDETSSPMSKRSICAGSTINNLLLNKHDSLMLFQLPASVSAISESLPVSIKSEESNKQQTAIHSTSQPSASQHCLDNFPTGVEIGKLQVLRSGRLVMKIGDHSLDVSEAIPSNCFETIVRIETEPSNHAPALDGPSTSNNLAPTGPQSSLNGFTSATSAPAGHHEGKSNAIQNAKILDNFLNKPHLISMHRDASASSESGADDETPTSSANIKATSSNHIINPESTPLARLSFQYPNAMAPSNHRLERPRRFEALPPTPNTPPPAPPPPRRKPYSLRQTPSPFTAQRRLITTSQSLRCTESMRSRKVTWTETTRKYSKHKQESSFMTNVDRERIEAILRLYPYQFSITGSAIPHRPQIDSPATLCMHLIKLIVLVTAFTATIFLIHCLMYFLYSVLYDVVSNYHRNRPGLIEHGPLIEATAATFPSIRDRN
ncbi:RNA polymerase III RPC4 domain-containing protein [Ditylenchus destructor]|uniref:RNA polymerase III RPC4 domain-containing protein n=1 Tax=Ditylenchus destructor TaxID=166010 RepID=A0AAD4NJ36_9BILA|nr:RNA polymerase III RPC4 domain-containing protein [Ditylenchus destructor]